MTPADLLATNPGALLNGWQDSRITSERVLQLLGHGHSLALAVEKWQRAGLWVITRSDPEYPIWKHFPSLHYWRPPLPES